MKAFFENDGQPNDEGMLVAVVEDDAGKRQAIYSAATMEELAGKLLKAQANANQALVDMRRTRRPDSAPAAEPIGDARELSADDKFRIATEIGDPQRTTGAIVDAVAAAFGATPAVIRQVLAESQERNRRQFFHDEALAFYTEHPGFLQVAENVKRLFLRLQLLGEREGKKTLDCTRNNLAIAYDELVSEGGLITPDTLEEWTAEHVALPATTAPQPTAAPAAPEGAQRQGPTPSETTSPARPRFADTSTGLRPGNFRGTRPAPAVSKLTREQVENMPSDEYSRRYQDPKFRADINALFAKRA